MANAIPFIASGTGAAIRGGIDIENQLEGASQQQEATKQAQQTTQARQLELDQQQQIMPGDTYLKLGAQDYAKKEQDFANRMQTGIQEGKESQIQQEHASLSQDASVYAFNQTMLGQNKAAADFVTKSHILNPQGIQYSDAQILDAQGNQTNDPSQAATFRLIPADKNQPPHDVPYQTLANLSRMKGTQVIQGKDGEMLVQTVSPAMNKGQPMITPAYTPTKINATREGDLYQETGPNANGTVLNPGQGGQLQGGALAREQKMQGIIKDGNQTIFKTLGADAFGSLNPEQQPLAMRATYLYEQSVRNGKPMPPAQAVAQAKQDLPVLQKRGQPIVPTGFQPFEGGDTNAQPSDATSQARAAFNKILGKSSVPAAAPQPSVQPAATPAAMPAARPAPAAAPVAPAAPDAAPVSLMSDANAAPVPAPVAVPPANGIEATPAPGSLQKVSEGDPLLSGINRGVRAIGQGINNVVASAKNATSISPGFIVGPNGTRTQIRSGLQTILNGQKMTFRSIVARTPSGPVWEVQDDKGAIYRYVPPVR